VRRVGELLNRVLNWGVAHPGYLMGATGAGGSTARTNGACAIIRHVGLAVR